MNLNKNSAIPLFVQLKQLITDQIDSQELLPDAQLPSEREISERYDISRQTVRLAINELVLQGVLYRRSGKGTYVAPQKVTQDLLHVTSFTQLILDWGKTTSIQKIACTRITAPAFVQRLLNLPPDSHVIEYVRLRVVEGENVALHRSYIPLHVGLKLEDLQNSPNSLIDLLNLCGPHRITRSSETMEPTVADPYEARMLGIRPKAPLQLITGRLLSETGEAVECHKSLYRGDKFSFSFEGVLDRAPVPERAGAGSQKEVLPPKPL